jgi:mobilization protein MobC
MNEIKKIRDRWLTIRLNEDEYSTIEVFYKKTTSNALSEYARDILLRKPVIVTYRNASADAFLSEMAQLKNELNAIGNNYNQAVKRLHTLDKIPEIKIWLMLNESAKDAFMKKTDEIKLRMNQLYDQWSQK